MDRLFPYRRSGGSHPRCAKREAPSADRAVPPAAHWDGAPRPTTHRHHGDDPAAIEPAPTNTAGFDAQALPGPAHRVAQQQAWSSGKTGHTEFSSMAAHAAALALIPARGGSKGIPGKNLQEVGGLPLVVRSIHAAQASDRVTRVVVSTDDEAIAELSRDAGADVVQRPQSIAGDSASSESALLHALDALACPSQSPNGCLLYTSPSPRDRQKSRMPSSA